MRLNRRTWLGGVVSSITGLFLPRAIATASSYNTDHFFDVIEGVPSIPLDVWFNKAKPIHHQWAKDPGTKYLVEFYRDQLPLYYPSEAVAEAISKLPPKLPCYAPPHDYTRTHEPADYVADKSTQPLFFAANCRITERDGTKWLTFDILTIKDDVPLELKSLNNYKKPQLLKMMEGEWYDEDRRHKGGPRPLWPEFWGVSGLGQDFLPAAHGEAELTEEGCRIQRLTIVSFCCSGYSTRQQPHHMRRFWFGEKWHYCDVLANQTFRKLRPWQQQKDFPNDPKGWNRLL